MHPSGCKLWQEIAAIWPLKLMSCQIFIQIK
uniref:Uncharacterized protein n=1 Tax=Anguilla anguilla TaxID=7936 RepID=A0A0E9STT3_ANGAN